MAMLPFLNPCAAALIATCALSTAPGVVDLSYSLQARTRRTASGPPQRHTLRVARRPALGGIAR